MSRVESMKTCDECNWWCVEVMFKLWEVLGARVVAVMPAHCAIFGVAVVVAVVW